MVVYMSASLPCMSWNSPIGWPNCLRSWMYGTATSMQAAMMPSGPPESTARSKSSPLISTLTPRPTPVIGSSPMPPRMLSAGTSQSSNTSSPVWLPRMPSLSSFCATRNPLKSFSTRKAVMPRGPAWTSFLA